MTQVIVEFYDWRSGTKQGTDIIELDKYPTEDDRMDINENSYHILEVLPEDLRVYPHPGPRVRVCEVHLQ